MDVTEFEPLGWILPAAVVLGSAVALVFVVALAVRRLRRGRGARRRAAAALAAAGAALVRLDDAVDELELEVGLSGALYGGDAPSSLRRARMTAQQTRDEAFAEYRAASDPAVIPAAAVRAAHDLHRRAVRALERIEDARREHRAWIQEHISAPEQVARAERHLAELKARMGDPSALLHELQGRADPAEWADAARAADEACAAVAEAEQRIAAARLIAADPTRSALEELEAAERALHRADAASRTLEESHRLVSQAALAVGDELEAAQAAIRSASSIRASLTPIDAERLTGEIHWAQHELERLRPAAQRRPVATIEAIARLRDRLDTALADAQTAQQRLHGARTALPGTLAAARSAITHAEAAILEHTGAVDARLRLDLARQEAAAARQTHDPVEALDAARRAIRQAEDAKALADHHRLTSP